MKSELKPRRQYLIMKRLQVRYMLLVLMSIVIVSAIIVWTVYFTHWALLTSDVTTQETKLTLSMIFQKINGLLLIQLPIMLMIVCLFSIYISHRIAGPVFRLTRSAHEVAGGNLGINIRLRRSDELKDLAGAFNIMIENIRRLVTEDKKMVAELSEITTNLYVDIRNHKVTTDEAVPIIRKLNDIINELNNLIQQYRVESK
ncbi:MAG: methyl-accepting chemotaxis protein [Candidatus Omnitrophota bacterium]